MSNAMRKWAAISVSVTVITAIALVTRTGMPMAQNPNDLQIISPATGTLVTPGSVLAVLVANNSGFALTSVAIIAEDPIGFTGLGVSGSRSAFELAVAIPSDINSGAYQLTAAASTATNAPLSSPPIAVDVERPDMPLSLQAEPTGIDFRFAGEQIPLIVTAAFADGTFADVTRSSLVTYKSDDEAVAVVDEEGLVAAMGPGSNGTTTVTVTYGSQAVAVPVSVPQTVRR